MTRRRGGRILPAMVALLLALLGVACASAATLAWRLVVFHERLRALEVGQAATSARVLALAPAQVDALDAAISARLALLDAAAEPAEALRALAELRTCETRDPACAEPVTPEPAAPPVSQQPAPPPPAPVAGRRPLEEREVGPWVEGKPPPSGKRCRERRGRDAVCWVYETDRCLHWHASAYSLDSSRREERGGWLADGAGWGAAEARAEAALLEVLLALPA